MDEEWIGDWATLEQCNRETFRRIADGEG